MVFVRLFISLGTFSLSLSLISSLIVLDVGCICFGKPIVFQSIFWIVGSFLSSSSSLWRYFNKNPKSFEHVDPTSVGNERRFLISEVAGKSTVITKIKKIYPEIKKDDPALNQIVNTIKGLEYVGYQFEGADASFELIVHKALGNFKSFFEVENFKTIGEGPSTENKYSASAIIKVRVEGEEEVTAANGDGPVDALNKALRKAIGRFYPILNEVSLADYKVRILDGKESATAAITRVIIESTDGKTSWSTVGVSKDIIEASFKALTDSIEYKLFKENN